jgi:hypothetical protein
MCKSPGLILADNALAFNHEVRESNSLPVNDDKCHAFRASNSFLNIVEALIYQLDYRCCDNPT